jgi:Flp pilus assembly protein TadD
MVTKIANFFSSKPEKQQNILIILVITLVTFLCFANSLLGEFIFDDHVLIEENPSIKIISKIFNLFLQSYWGENNSDGLYRPLTHISFALNFFVNGLNTYGYHLVNILVHTINALLIYWISERYTKIKSLSLLCALLFSAHPVHSEAVAAIYGRPELMATMFLLIAWCFFIKSSQNNFWYVLSLISYFLSLLCKESGIIFVGILLLVHICQETSWTTRLKPSPKLLGYILTTIPYLILRVAVTKVLGIPKGGQILGNEPFLTRVFTMSYGYFKYFVLLIWPAKLYTDYDFSVIPKITNLSLPVFAYLLIIFGIIAIAFWQLKHNPIISFAILFFFVTTSIISNIFLPTGILIAERTIYLSTLSISLLLAAICYRLYQQGWQTLAVTFSIVILLATSARTFYRNNDFQNDFALFSSIAKLSPNNSKANVSLGLYYEKIDELEKAEIYYKRVLELFPEQSRTYGLLINLYLRQNRYSEAIAVANVAGVLFPKDVYVLVAIGRLYNQKQDYKKAAEYFTSATKYAIPNAKLEHELGLNLYYAGDLEQATFRMKKSIEMDPAFAEPMVNLARIEQKQNNFDEAEKLLNKALSLDPNNSDTYNLYGANFLAQKKLCEAKKYLLKSIAINDKIAETHYNLGLVYSQMGHFDEARNQLLIALGFNPKFEKARTELMSLKQKASLSITPVDCPN